MSDQLDLQIWYYHPWRRIRGKKEIRSINIVLKSSTHIQYIVSENCDGRLFVNAAEDFLSRWEPDIKPWEYDDEIEENFGR